MTQSTLNEMKQGNEVTLKHTSTPQNCMICGKGRYCLNCQANGDNHAAMSHEQKEPDAFPKRVWLTAYPYQEYRHNKEQAEFVNESVEYGVKEYVPADDHDDLVTTQLQLVAALERMKSIALRYAPITEHGDGSAFNQANLALAKANNS